jgi:hypothetical protein
VWNWYFRVVMYLYKRPSEEPQKAAGIPEGYSTHDYVGGFTLLKNRTIGEIQKRSKKGR